MLSPRNGRLSPLRLLTFCNLERSSNRRFKSAAITLVGQASQIFNILYHLDVLYQIRLVLVASGVHPVSCQLVKAANTLPSANVSHEAKL